MEHNPKAAGQLLLMGTALMGTHLRAGTITLTVNKAMIAPVAFWAFCSKRDPRKSLIWSLHPHSSCSCLARETYTLPAARSLFFLPNGSTPRVDFLQCSRARLIHRVAPFKWGQGLILLPPGSDPFFLPLSSPSPHASLWHEEASARLLGPPLPQVFNKLLYEQRPIPGLGDSRLGHLGA